MRSFLLPFLFHSRRKVLSYGLEGVLRLGALKESLINSKVFSPDVSSPELSPENATASDALKESPEDFRPLENSCFQNPYAFYAMLRKDYPLYQLPNGIYFAKIRFEKGQISQRIVVGK